MWQSVSGVSAGSINAGGVSLFDIGDEENMTQFLVDTALSLRNGDVWQEWPGGYLDGLFTESGVIDSSPLHNTLKKIFKERGEKIRKKVTVSAVNVEDGSFRVFNELNTSPADMPTACLASSSIPFVFPHTQLHGMTFMDGGVAYGTNLAASVERCREEVENDEDIVLDVILCGGVNRTEIESTGNSYDNYLRAKDI